MVSGINAKVFPEDKMTSRERMLAAYRGEQVDRLPYWAKVTNGTWRAGQPQNVKDMTPLELLDFIHADGIFGAGAGMRVIRPHVQTEIDQSPTRIVETTRTPDGDMQELWAIDQSNGSRHPVEFPVKTVEDIRRYRWVYTDLQFEHNDEALAQARQAVREIGERGVFHSGWGTSPLMHLVEHVIGPVDTHLMLVDYPEEMAELIDLMHQANLRIVREIARRSPADAVVSVENTSTTLISPQQFEQFCYRHLCDYGKAIQTEGKMHELHMCGHTRVLLSKIDSIPASSIEAYTSPTLGNTRLADGRADAPSKTLIGGTNVNTWLRPLDEIQAYIEHELADCRDHRHIVLTTAGVAPPGCPAEKFRAVGDWLRTVAVRM